MKQGYDIRYRDAFYYVWSCYIRLVPDTGIFLKDQIRNRVFFSHRSDRINNSRIRTPPFQLLILCKNSFIRDDKILGFVAELVSKRFSCNVIAHF